MERECTADEHSWFLSNALARRCGLLPEGEEARFDKHLSECPECREAWEANVAADEAMPRDIGHIPAGMIARWNLARERLRGIERDMVRQHLEFCEECSQDLELAGFEPVLDRVPRAARQAVARREMGRPATGAAGTGGPEEEQPTSERHTIKLVHRNKKKIGLGWTDWILRGWAVATAAAAVIVWFALRSGGPASDHLGGAVVPWVAPAQMRGPGAQNTSIVPRETRSVALAVRVPPLIPRDASAVIKVHSPDDELVFQTVVTKTDLKHSALMVVLQSDEPLAAGTYRVTFSAEGMTEPTESYFVIRHVEEE